MRIASLLAIGVVGSVLLAGCSATASPSPAPTGSLTSAPTPSATPTAVALHFAMPTECASILPQSRLDTFASQALVLLGGPGGKFGTKYLSDSTPEESAGGITCIWGDDATSTSSITVSVAPLGSNRASVVADLLNQGLNEGTIGNSNTFFQQGDTSHAPAILNVVHPDSWISIITTIGGPGQAQTAVTIADEVASILYVTG